MRSLTRECYARGEHLSKAARGKAYFRERGFSPGYLQSNESGKMPSGENMNVRIEPNWTQIREGKLFTIYPDLRARKKIGYEENAV